MLAATDYVIAKMLYDGTLRFMTGRKTVVYCSVVILVEKTGTQLW